MRIKRICYPVNVLGPGKRVGIWVTGCGFACPGCMSPELQDPHGGKEMDCLQIVESIGRITDQIDGITISGGEPFDQAPELRRLVTLLCRLVTEDIIIYSGYTLQQLQQRNCPDTNAVLAAIAVLIDGRYVESLDDGKGLRGSSNQCIHIFRNRDHYTYMADCTRQLQVFNYKNAASLMVGLL